MVRFWPTVNKFVVRLLAFFKSSTDTLKLLAIDHSVSPFFTVYICFVSSFRDDTGILNSSPAFRFIVSRLLKAIISFTGMPYRCDIFQRLSPLWTVYIKYGISGSVGGVGSGSTGTVGSAGSVDAGISICWPGSKVLLVRVFNSLIVDTVVPNLLAIPYNVSPLWTV